MQKLNELINQINNERQQQKSSMQKVRELVESMQQDRNEISNITSDISQKRKNYEIAYEDLQQAEKNKQMIQFKTIILLQQPAYLIYDPFEKCSLQFNQLSNNQQYVINSLTENRYVILDDFFADELAQNLLNEAQFKKNNGHLVLGKTGGGNSGTKITNEGLRDDLVQFQDKIEGNNVIQRMLEVINPFLIKIFPFLNETKNIFIEHGSPMITCYPGNNSRYVTHIDNPDNNGRVLTCIIYLNINRETSDGGELRIHDYPYNKNEQINFIDIEPKFNRLILFWSDERVFHEVLPNKKERYAITTWFYNSKIRYDNLISQI